MSSQRQNCYANMLVSAHIKKKKTWSNNKKHNNNRRFNPFLNKWTKQVDKAVFQRMYFGWNLNWKVLPNLWAEEHQKLMVDFWRQGEDNGRRTRVGGGWIPVGDSRCKRKMDDRPQRESVGVVSLASLGCPCKTLWPSRRQLLHLPRRPFKPKSK